MNVMDLMAKIGLDDREYNEKLDSDGGKFEGFGKTLASGAKSIAKAGVAAFAAIGTAIGGATTALVSNAKETANYADTVDKMSQKLGVSTEAYQEWDYVLNISGTSMQSMQTGLKTLTNKLDDAKNGSEDAAAMFEQLGLSMEDIQNMSREEIFEAAIAGFQGMEDSAERAALANDLFGKSGQELAPLFNTTAEETARLRQEVNDLGGVMSDEAVKAGAAFKDSLTGLQTAFTGAKNSMMSEFMPSLTTVTDGLAKLVSGDKTGVNELTEGITGLASKIGEVLPDVLDGVAGVADAVIGSMPVIFDAVATQLPSILEKLIPTVVNAVSSLADSVVKALPSLMEAVQKNISVITQGLKKLFTALGKIIIQLVPTLLPVLLEVGMELVMELARGFTENASEVIRTVIELINMLVVELTNPDTLMQLLECGIQILTALVNGIAENLPLLLETAGTLITNLATFLVEAIPELVVAIGQNGAKIITEVLPQILTSIGQAGADLLLKISSIIAGWIPDIVSGAKEAFESLGKGILNAWDWVKSKVMEIGTNILTTIQAALSTIFEVGKNLVQGLWNGINNAKDWVLDKIKGFGTGILDGIKDFFGISSPSKKTAVFGRFLAEGLAVGVEEEAPAAFDDIQNAIDKGMDGLELDTLDINAVGNVGMHGKVATVYDLQSAKVDMLVNAIYDYINAGHEDTFIFSVGGRVLDELVLDSKRRLELRSGGQVNV